MPFTATFTEPMAFGTSGNIVVKKVSDSTTVATFPATSPGANMSIAGAVLTLAGTGFPAATALFVAIDTGALRDLAGNPFAGVVSPLVWTFTTPGGAGGLPLDGKTNVIAAFSTRKLRTAYSGPCCQIYRPVGALTYDVPFDAATGWLDIAAMNTFLAGNTYFGLGWYDQSLSANHSTMLPGGNNIQIHATGANGKPAIVSDPVLYGNFYVPSITLPQYWTCIAGVKSDVATGLQMILYGDFSVAQYLRYNNASLDTIAFDGATAISETLTPATPMSWHVLSSICATNSPGVQVWQDGTGSGYTPTTGTTSNGAGKQLFIGSHAGSTYPFDGFIGEVILLDTYDDAERLALVASTTAAFA